MSACGCVPDCGFPPCIDCGEDHGSSSHGRCRDCDIQYMLARMQCSVCKRMRYATDTPLGDIGAALWGDRCACSPRPPSMADVRPP